MTTHTWPTSQLSAEACIKAYAMNFVFQHSTGVDPPSDDPLLGRGLFFFKKRVPPLPFFRETSLDIQVFYSICGSDHPSSRSITLPAAFINDLVSQPAPECSRLSRMIDH